MSNIINQIKNMKKTQQGFTIVELLIVIVVIAILAAITIVAYNGIQARAKTSSANQAATQVAKKAELYNADDTTSASGYPVSGSILTGAASTTTYQVTGVTFGTPAASATPSTLVYQKCGHTGTTTTPTTAASITVTTGAKIGYWDYVAGSTQYVNAGQTSGSVGTYPVGCFANN